MKLTQALILERIILAPGYYRLRLLAPEIAALAEPGQFIELKAAADGSVDPLLSRPVSIYRIDKNEGTIDIIFKEAGRGTRLIAANSSGSLISIFGPVGNGFTSPGGAKSIALIAGGIGMPPLYGLAQANPGKNYTLYYGGRSKLDLLELDKWAELGIQVKIATDDGSCGYHGLITKVFMADLTDKKYDYIAACGPKPMLKAVQQIALEHRIPGELSLEAYMACGVGACLGCVCDTRDGYKRVCVDGPVFPINEVMLDD